MLENITQAFNYIVLQTQANLFFLLSVLGILLVIHLLNALLNYRLLALGIYPRSIHGLLGIAFAPLLHADFNHLFFNAIPLFVLMDFMLLYSPHTWEKATLGIVLISGLLTWLLGRRAIHVGISGVVTGYWGYLVYNMYTHSNVISIILGILCIYYFAGIFFGILPLRKTTSWEGHLFGLVAGVLTAIGLTYY